ADASDQRTAHRERFRLRRRRRGSAEVKAAPGAADESKADPPPETAAALAHEAPPPNEAQRRRDQARMQVELAYLRAAPEISARFARAMFDDFVQRYLGDQLPPEDVEANGRQLLAILHQHRPPVPEPQRPLTLEDLARWLLD